MIISVICQKSCTNCIPAGILVTVSALFRNAFHRDFLCNLFFVAPVALYHDMSAGMF